MLASGIAKVIPSRVVIAPANSKTRPSIVQFAPSPIAALEIIVPFTLEFAPTLAAPSAIQNILEACAPLIKTICVPAPIAKAAPNWNTKILFGSPCPSTVTVP